MRKNTILLATLFFIGIITVNGQFRALLEFNATNGALPIGGFTFSGGTLYGATTEGGAYFSGCIFSMDTNGSGYKDLYDFNGTTTGNGPFGTLVYSGGVLYGMTVSGGTGDSGCIFSVNASGGGYMDLYNFSGANGNRPDCQLTISGNVLYGTTQYGGKNHQGIIFSINTNGTGFTDLFDFDVTNGSGPGGSLVLANGVLYGQTSEGGANGEGNIYSIKTNGTGFKDMLDFAGATNGYEPNGFLTLIGNNLYGTTLEGGTNNDGIMFSIDTSGAGFRNLFNIPASSGYEPDPEGSLTLVGNKFYCMTDQGGSINSGNIFSIDTSGSGYTDVYDFTGTNGEDPNGSLLLLNGRLYGMTPVGGTNSEGLVFGYYISGALGINELTANSRDIKVYPNPNKGIFTIESLVPNSKSSIEVYNMMGQKVFTQPLQITSLNSINMGSQPAGMYLYRVITVSGDAVGEGNLIIQ